MIQEKAAIIGRRQLSPGVYKYLLSSPGIARTAAAGQFVQVTAPGFFLRRPISICRIDPEAGTLVLVMEVRGSGTAAIAQLGSEDSLDLIGPLGSGFQLADPKAHALLVGGGIGVPPLCQAAAHHGANAVVAAGFRSAGAVILRDEVENLGASFLVATDDGTAGHHGLVTDLVKAHLAETKTDVIYACGPMPMLRAVAAIAKEQGIACQVSLEERMACGMGACLGCATALLDDNGEQYYGHVCKDGPVFPAERVVW